MGTDIVLWDNGTLGNYWDDYAGLDENGDEIGDTSYIIDENNQDNYPSMYPVDISTIPEFPSWVILPLLAAMILVILIFRKDMKLLGKMSGSKVNSSFFSGDNSRVPRNRGSFSARGTNSSSHILMNFTLVIPQLLFTLCLRA